MKCEVCGACVLEYKTTAGAGIFDAEQVRGGAWILHPTNGYMFRRGSGPRYGYQIHKCQSAALSAPTPTKVFG